MSDENKGKLCLIFAILGFLFGIVWMATHHTKPIIGDCGVNVEANLIYAKMSVAATKFLGCVVFSILGLLASVIILLVVEGFIAIKDKLTKEPEVKDEFSLTNYNFTYVAKGAVGLLGHAGFMLLAIPVSAMILYAVILSNAPDACYLNKDSQGDFIMSTFLSVFIITFALSGLVSWLYTLKETEINRFLFAKNSTTSVDSIACYVPGVDLKEFFPNEKDVEYTVSCNTITATRDGKVHHLEICGTHNDRGYILRIYNHRHSILKKYELNNYTLREAINFTRRIYREM